MTKKILITGGKGFVGSILGSQLLKRGHQVYSPEADLLFESTIQDIRNRGPWDVVIHLAGISDTKACKEDPEKAQAVNVRATGQIAEICAQQEVKPHFLFSSTGMIYKPTEEALVETSTIEPQNAYAETKLAAELLLTQIAIAHDLPVTVLRLFNHTHRTQDPRFFLPFIYQELMAIKNKQRAPVISVGNIKVHRDLGIIQDLLKAFYLLVEGSHLPAVSIFNLCSGQSRRLDNLASELARQLDLKVEFSVDPAKLRQDHEFIVGSSQKFQNAFSWKPQVLTDQQFIEKFLEKL